MNFEEKTLRSKLVYEGKVIKVFRDDVKLANGENSVREVAKHPGGVVVLAFKDNETILLVKQYRYPIGKTVLELPAGKLEKDEKPDRACRRELEEETGYKAKNWQSLGYINTTPGFCDEKLYLYKAENLEFVGEHLDEGEILKAYEYKLKNVKNMIKSGEINDAKTICAIMRAEIND